MMTKKFKLFEVPILEKRRGLSIHTLNQRAKAFATNLCEMIPELIGLRTGELIHEVSACDDKLMITFFLVRSPQLLLQFGAKRSQSESYFLEEDAYRIIQNLYKIQEALDRDAFIFRGLEEAPFGLRSPPNSRLFGHQRRKTIELQTESGSIQIVSPPRPPLLPISGSSPDFIRASVSAVESDFLKLSEVSYLRGTGHISLARAQRIQLPKNPTRDRIAILAQAALRSATPIEVKVRPLANPQNGRICGLLVGAEVKLSQRADRNVSRGWLPILDCSAVDKCKVFCFS